MARVWAGSGAAGCGGEQRAVSCRVKLPPPPGSTSITKLTTRIHRWEEAFTPLFNAFPGTLRHFWHSGCIPQGSNGTAGTTGSRGRVRGRCK